MGMSSSSRRCCSGEEISISHGRSPGTARHGNFPRSGGKTEDKYCYLFGDTFHYWLDGEPLRYWMVVPSIMDGDLDLTHFVS